jgi:predicted nucleic acid-binding protein
MRNILLDTDVLINFLRGKEKARLFLESAVRESVLFCSVITVAEIHSGMLVLETERTREILEGLHIVEVTRGIAEKAGGIKGT